MGFIAIYTKNLLMEYYRSIQDEIDAIRQELDTDKRLVMLHNLNESLPRALRLQFPSLITSAYIRTALDRIEERALVSSA